jgi:hypothetical protein
MGWLGGVARCGGEDGEANLSDEAARRGGEARRRGRRGDSEPWWRGGAASWGGKAGRQGGSEAARRELLGMVAKSLQAKPTDGQLASTRRK